MKYLFLFINVFLGSSLLFCQEVKLEDLQSVLGSNKTIYVKNGTYNDINLNVESLKNVTIKAINPGKVKISGASQIKILNSNNITVEGLSFVGNSSKELISIENSKFVTVTNNLFFRNGSVRYGSVIIFKGNSLNGKVLSNTFDSNYEIGIALLKGSKNVLIRNNSFMNVPNVLSIYPKSDGNGMECIQIGREGNWDSEATVEYNSFNNIVGDRAEIISVKSDMANIINNNFVDCHGGVTLRLSNSSIISNNYFNNVSNSIRVFGKNHIISDNSISSAMVGIQLPSADANSNNVGQKYLQSSNIVIRNNNITKTKVPIALGNGYSKKRSYLPIGVTISNNRFDKKEWVTKDSKLQNFISESNVSDPKTSIMLKKVSSGKSW